MTPTQRTLQELKRRGFKWVQVVEKWNAYAVRGDGKRGLRQDLFGFIDIICLDCCRGIVGVQSTGTDFSGHHQKITTEKADAAIAWLSCPGAHLELWGWRKVKVKRGGKKEVYEPRIKVYTLLDFESFNPLN